MNTPTPWKVKKTNYSNRNAIYNGSERLFVIEDYVYSNEMALERAAEIVRAVNYHDRLVECLKKFVDNGVAVGGDNFHSELLLHNTAQQLLTEIEKSNGK